ncbi:type II secretion system minor pseudopilin GspJ [Nevskia ramosa]|uniref:type II secretion system minor pseudopilin GspJ n=1 Tax=Nevskia ramosa TaxID=64002 RepID=UPI003D12A452
MRSQRGFTLLELIVVIGIFGVFATMAYGGLNTVLSARAKIEDNLSRTEEYDRAYIRLRTDFQNAAPRGVRDSTGQELPPFGFDSFAQRIEFTRGGWQNLLSLPRSTLERVSYGLEESEYVDKARGARFQDKRLVRRSWNVLDRAAQTKPIEVTMLDRIEEAEWRFYDANGQKSEAWPSANGNAGVPNAQQPPPTAIELTLKTRDWGKLRLLFRVGAEGASKIAELSKVPPPAPPGKGPGGTTSGTTVGTSGSTTGGTTGSTNSPGGLDATE